MLERLQAMSAPHEVPVVVTSSQGPSTGARILSHPSQDYWDHGPIFSEAVFRRQVRMMPRTGPSGTLGWRPDHLKAFCRDDQNCALLYHWAVQISRDAMSPEIRRLINGLTFTPITQRCGDW